MFDWNDLRYFIEVTRTNSLSGAATRFGVSHTTVARRIQALEESLSVRLFDKTPGGYRLTETGAHFLTLAERVETACISAEEFVAGEDPTLNGVVRLSVPAGFGTQFLPRHLTDFRRRQPGIELEVIALFEALSISKREAHIAISVNEPSVGRLVARALTDYVFQFYASRAYLKRSPPIQTLEDLSRHEVITGIVSLPDYHFVSDVVPEAHAKLRFRSMNAQVAAVAAGVGISLIPRYMAATVGHLVPVLPEHTVTRTLWMSMHEDMRHVRRVAAVWSWLKELAAANQDIFVGPPRARAAPPSRAAAPG